MRIAIISDTHLSPRVPAFDANLAAALNWCAATPVDLIVNLGDVTADGAAHPEEFAHAQVLLEHAGVRVVNVPGNHDVGEALASPRSAGEEPFRREALDAFRRTLGPDHWSIDADGWQLVGLNAQVIGNGDADEAEQDRWLDTALDQSDAPLGLFLHKPLFRDGPGDAPPHQRYLPSASAGTLLARVRRRDLRFIVTGHAHQYRRFVLDGVEHVWAPSLAYVIPDAMQERIGEKVVAMMMLDLDAASHRFDLVVSDGLTAYDLADCAAIYPELGMRA